MHDDATTGNGVERKRGRGRPPVKKPGQKNKLSAATISRDIRLMGLTSLNFVGGVQYLNRVAKTNPAAYLAFIAKLVQRDDGADAERINFVVQEITINAVPTPGVLSSPVAGHIQAPRLIANGGEVVDMEPSDG